MEKTEIEKTKQNYTVSAKIFHWGFVILFAYGISKQVDNINQLEDLALLKFEITFALLFILFLSSLHIHKASNQKYNKQKSGFYNANK